MEGLCSKPEASDGRIYFVCSCNDSRNELSLDSENISYFVEDLDGAAPDAYTLSELTDNGFQNVDLQIATINLPN